MCCVFVVAHDKAMRSAVFDECWPRDTQTGIPYPLKKTQRFPIAAPPYIERICYATFNYRAGYTAENHIYAKGTVIAAFRGYTPLPLPPSPIATIYVVSLPLAGTAAFDLWFVGMLKQQQKRAGGIIKNNTNAVKNQAATQAFPGDNVDEAGGWSPRGQEGQDELGPLHSAEDEEDPEIAAILAPSRRKLAKRDAGEMEEIREKQSKMPASTNSQGRKFTKSDTKNLLPKMCNLMRYCREVGYVMAGNTYGPRKHMPPPPAAAEPSGEYPASRRPDPVAAVLQAETTDEYPMFYAWKKKPDDRPDLRGLVRDAGRL
eukprot:jgi/Tetstr1/448257/TSEL_035544.t2